MLMIVIQSLPAPEGQTKGIVVEEALRGSRRRQRMTTHGCEIHEDTSEVADLEVDAGDDRDDDVLGRSVRQQQNW